MTAHVKQFSSVSAGPAVQHSTRVSPYGTGPLNVFELRCEGTHNGMPCRKLIAREVTAPYAIECPRCGHMNQAT